MQTKEIQSSRQTAVPYAQYPHCTSYSASSCTIGCTSSWTGTRHQTKPDFDEDTGSLDSNLGHSGASYTRLNTKAFGTPHDVKKLESQSSSSCKDYTKNSALKSEPTQKSCEVRLLRGSQQGDPLSSPLFQHAHAQDICEWKRKNGESRSETLKARSSQTSGCLQHSQK